MRLARKVLSTVLMISMILGNFVVPVGIVMADTNNNDTNIVKSASASTNISNGYAATDVTFAPGQNATELNFAWYSNVLSPSGAVQIAKKADMTGAEFPTDKATTYTGAVSPAATGFYSNKVTVTNLQEATQYVYRVGDGSAENWSPVFNFTTHQTDSFSFLSVGDPQIGASGSVASDTAGWKDTMSKAFAQNPDVSFLASLGDQINDNTDESEYTGFFAPLELRSLPVSTLIGNHENGAPNYTYHFNPPNLSSQYGITTNTSSDYYFTYGKTLFMVLNTNNPSAAEHDAFMQQAINATPNATWKVVMFHQDIYGSADHALDVSIVNLRQTLFPVFDKDKIDLVLDGHDHCFTRSYQMLGDQAQTNQNVDANGVVLNPTGTLYMTLNSGSGSKYYDLQPTPETYSAVRKQIYVPTFSKITDTPNSLNISTYRTDTMAMTDTYTMKKLGSQPTLDLSQLTISANGATLATDDPSSNVKLSLVAKNSQNVNVDLTGASVIYKTDKPDMLSIAADGTVTVKQKPALNTTAKVWAEVYNGSTFVSSNQVDINVNTPYGLAVVTLATDGSTLSTDTTGASIKLSLTGKDTLNADMDLSSATVNYKTDNDGVLAISSDGTVTVQNKPAHSVIVNISADVIVNGKTVTSNTVPLTVGPTTVTGISISEARSQGATTVPVTVTGVVTCVNPTSDGSYFIQDSTAGINVYKSGLSPAPQQGDIIQVTGPMSLYHGLLEMTPSVTNVSIISSANPLPTPKIVTIDQLTDNQSQLVKINNVTLGTINNGGSTTITDDAGHSTVIYQIPTLTGISAGDKVDITAINSAYTTPELLVRGAADIVKTGSIQAARNLGAGQTATVTGIVTCVNPTTAGSYFIQDGTAGICVYNTSLSPAPQQGDMIQVTGPMTVYKGLLEIAPTTATDYSNLSSGNTLPDPTVVTIDQLGNYQSQLVKVKNITLGTINNSGNTTITDDSANSSIFYRMPTVTGISAGDKVDITAVVAAYNTPELIARNAADITKSVASNDKTFDIVEVTDLHGNIGDTSSNQVAGVMAENIKDNVYANNPDRTLILSGGDNYQGTAISNLEYGDPVMKIFNYMGFAASALGNHEFDWGLEKVTDVNGSKVTATYPIICANVFPEGNTTTPVFDPYKIFTLDGVKVAVVGGITESTPGIVSAGSLNGYQVLSNVTYINKYAAQAKAEGAQIVIALIHEGDDYNNGASGPIVDIAKNLVGVDAVLGGHTHDIVKSTVTTNAGKTIPLEIGNHNGYGYIDLQMVEHEDGSFSFDNANSAYVAEDTSSTVYPYGFKATTPTVDPTAQQIVADTMTAEGPILTKVLGSAQINLDRTQADSPYGESLVGNWATDVMRSESKADFAFQNNGGLRCDIPQGQVDMSTIYQFMPFDNVTETCDMTGAQLKVILEEAVADGGMGIQLSGLKFTYDSTKPTGSRVLSIAKSDGTTVDMNDTTTTYKVATNDFMAGGTTASPKDGFTFSDQSSNMTNTYVLVRDALADAVTAAGSTGITAQIEGRIKNDSGTGSSDTLNAHTKIAVLSDTHYYAPELGTTGTAFETYLASDRKLLAESKATNVSAIDSIKNSDAQIVLVSGDLTKDGELLCHQQFAGLLKQLKDAGKKVYVIDGNHDINNPDACSYNGDQTTPVANITPDDFKNIYHDYGYGDAVAVDPNSLSYAVDPAPGLRIIAMDSALYDTNLADHAPKTAGAFSASRLAWIDAEITDGVAKGKTVIGMMHHGLTNHFSLESQLFPEYVVQDADEVAANLSSHGMKMVFTGHFHASDITEKQLPNNQFIFDAETGSLVTYPVPYRLCDLTSDGKLTINTNRVTNINYDTGNKSFQNYAKDILVDGLGKLVPGMLAGIIQQQQPGLTADQAMAAANNAASQVVAPTSYTVKDLLVNAMVGHYQGDETTDSQTLAIYQGMAASSDAMTKTLGGVLLSLGTDLVPADNNVILNLNNGSADPLSETVAPTWSSPSLAGSNITQTGLTLTWSTASDNVGVTNYKVFLNGTLLDTVTSNTLTYNVNGLNAATQYSFKVEAGDAAGNWSVDGPSTIATTLAATSVPTTPPAPGLGDQDTVENSFGWVNSPGFPNLTDYEYSLDGGQTYSDCTANPIQLPNQVYAVGSIKVRVKADTVTGRSAGDTLSSTVAFTGSTNPGTGPNYTGVSIDNAKIVTIKFNEPLVANVSNLKDAVSIATDGLNYQPLGSNDNVVIKGSSLEVSFANELTGKANKIKIAANALKDETNVVQTQEIMTDAFDATIDECFIATASFGSKFEPSVVLLRNFRDRFLLTNSLGKAFVKFYYHNSPPIAKFIAGNEVLKIIVRVCLTPLVVLVYFLFNPMLLVLLLTLFGMAVVWIKRRRVLAQG